MIEASDINSAKELFLTIEEDNKEYFLKIMPKFECLFPNLKEHYEYKINYNSYISNISESLKKNQIVKDFNAALEIQEFLKAKKELTALINSDILKAIEIFKVLRYHKLSNQLDLDDE